MNARDHARADERATHLAEHRSLKAREQQVRQQERELARRRCTAVGPVSRWVEDPTGFAPGCAL